MDCVLQQTFEISCQLEAENSAMWVEIVKKPIILRLEK